eukprot:jgi/Mesvir1/7000/Mv26515-RA.1
MASSCSRSATPGGRTAAFVDRDCSVCVTNVGSLGTDSNQPGAAGCLGSERRQAGRKSIATVRSEKLVDSVIVADMSLIRTCCQKHGNKTKEEGGTFC